MENDEGDADPDADADDDDSCVYTMLVRMMLVRSLCGK